MEMAYAELLLCGVTTVVDLSGPVEGWFDCAGRSGLRVYIGPFFADAHWKLENRHELGFDWDETRGRRYFEEAIRIMDLAEQHPSGRLRGIVYPGQIETCTESTLRDAAAHARERGRPLTTHLSQSRLEFHEIVRRHGKTPLEYAADIDFLGPGTILGHALFIDEHPDIRWRGCGDLDRLADSGTSVAHCPSPFARYGQARRRTGRSAMSSSTDDRWSRTGSPCISTRIEPGTNSKSPRRGCSRMHPGATSSAAPGTRSRPVRFPFESHTIRARSHLFRAGADSQSQPM